MTQFLIFAQLSSRDEKTSRAADRLKANLPKPCQWLMRDDSSSHIILTCLSDFSADKIAQIAREHVSFCVRDLVVVTIDEVSSLYNISPIHLKEPEISLTELFLKKQERRGKVRTPRVKRRLPKRQVAEIKRVFGDRKKRIH